MSIKKVKETISEGIGELKNAPAKHAEGSWDTLRIGRLALAHEALEEAIGNLIEMKDEHDVRVIGADIRDRAVRANAKFSEATRGAQNTPGAREVVERTERVRMLGEAQVNTGKNFYDEVEVISGLYEQIGVAMDRLNYAYNVGAESATKSGPAIEAAVDAAQIAHDSL
jgi:hypothetical protein